MSDRRPPQPFRFWFSYWSSQPPQRLPSRPARRPGLPPPRSPSRPESEPQAQPKPPSPTLETQQVAQTPPPSSPSRAEKQSPTLSPSTTANKTASKPPASPAKSPSRKLTSKLSRTDSKRRVSSRSPSPSPTSKPGEINTADERKLSQQNEERESQPNELSSQQPAGPAEFETSSAAAKETEEHFQHTDLDEEGINKQRPSTAESQQPAEPAEFETSAAAAKESKEPEAIADIKSITEAQRLHHYEDFEARADMLNRTDEKSTDPVAKQHIDPETLPHAIMHERQTQETKLPEQVQPDSREVVKEMKITSPIETAKSDMEISKEMAQNGETRKGSNIAITSISGRSIPPDQRSFQTEIREGLSKLVQKLNVGQSQIPGERNAVTIITLAGDNRGATMVIGSEGTDREGFVHIHGGEHQHARKIDASRINDPKEIKAHSGRSSPSSLIANVNCNVQSINNSLMQESSFNDKDPGVHLVFPAKSTESVALREKSIPETFKTTSSISPAQKVTYEPNIKRRCLRSLLLESDDDQENPQRPRRHGCRFSCDDKKKGTSESDQPSTIKIDRQNTEQGPKRG